MTKFNRYAPEDCLCVMLDIETDRTQTATAQITSIALVPFTFAKGREGLRALGVFHAAVKYNASEACPDTMKWRKENRVDVMEEALFSFATNSEMCEAAVNHIKGCLNFADKQDVLLFSKPTSFDIPILSNVFQWAGVKPFWHYRATCDVNSYIHGLNAAKGETVGSIDVEELVHDMLLDTKATAHCAFTDCLLQIAKLRMNLLPAEQTREIIAETKKEIVDYQDLVYREARVEPKVSWVKMRLSDFCHLTSGRSPEKDSIGHLVEYENRSIGWEESTYSPGASCEGVSFGLALLALEKGFTVGRAGWNGKGMWLVYIPTVNKAGYFEQSIYRTYLGDNAVTSKARIDICTEHNAMQPGWNASQADMLAKDWVIHPRPIIEATVAGEAS